MSKFETFDILSWDPIYVNSENTNAMIYIKPTLNLLKYFQQAPMNNILVSIIGTNHEAYENKIIFGTIDKSSDIPNKRDNMFNCTGLYCITLDLVWQGYPLEKGKIVFYTGVVDKIIEEIVPTIPPEISDNKDIPRSRKDVSPINNNNYTSLIKNSGNTDTKDSSKNDMDNTKIFLIITCILIIIGIIYWKFL